MIRPAVLAGLSVLVAAWSAEGGTVYRRAAARPSSATAVLGGPAAKPGAVIGGPAEPKGGLSGGHASLAPGPSKHRSGPGRAAPAIAGQGALAAAATDGRGQPPAARSGRFRSKDKSDDHATRR